MAFDTACCPLCGQPNRCVMAAGQDKEPCWCSEAEFPQALLDQVPAEAREKACICKACVDAFNKK